MRQLTVEILKELGFQPGERNGRLFYQKGSVLLLYVDSGVWEFAADHGTPMSDGMIIATEEELNKLMNDHE